MQITRHPLEFFDNQRVSNLPRTPSQGVLAPISTTSRQFARILSRRWRLGWMAYPRSLERGPIEALPPEMVPTVKTDIRALSSAAPLKRGQRGRHVRRIHRYPRSLERGPIEAAKRIWWAASGRYIRALSSAAPLKLCLQAGEDGVHLISALSRARPH
jgi:hypothetical protein